MIAKLSCSPLLKDSGFHCAASPFSVNFVTRVLAIKDTEYNKRYSQILFKHIDHHNHLIQQILKACYIVIRSIVFIPRHTIVAGYYGFTLDVRVSVRPSVVHPSVFRFRMITSKLQWIFIKLGMCIDIVDFGLGLLMSKFRQIFTE